MLISNFSCKFSKNMYLCFDQDSLSGLIPTYIHIFHPRDG